MHAEFSCCSANDACTLGRAHGKCRLTVIAIRQFRTCFSAFIAGHFTAWKYHNRIIILSLLHICLLVLLQNNWNNRGWGKIVWYVRFGRRRQIIFYVVEFNFVLYIKIPFSYLFLYQLEWESAHFSHKTDCNFVITTCGLNAPVY